MYCYKIGYHSYEESEDCVLLHQRKWTHDEITDLIIEAILQQIKGPFTHHFKETFQYMYNDIIEFLVDEKGFEYLEYDDKWSIFGWASVADREDWPECRGPELGRITDALAASGVKTAGEDDE